MKRIVISFVAVVMLAGLTQTAEAQWVRRYYYRPMFASPRFYRAPVVVSQPTTVVYTRRRPILGRTVVRTRPAYRRVIF